jgi:hypothetical protein
MGKCVCITGYVPTDGSNPDSDSDVDCQKIVYERCDSDKLLDSNGVCRIPTDCSDQCDGAYGKI